MTERDERLRWTTKLIYGVGDVGNAAVNSAVQFFLMIFYTDAALVAPALAASALLVGKVWDAVNDPLFGWISDRTASRFGKRRVYMIFGALPLAITIVLLWRVPRGLPDTGVFAWIALTFMFFDTAWTLTNCPTWRRARARCWASTCSLGRCRLKTNLAFLGTTLALAAALVGCAVQPSASVAPTEIATATPLATATPTPTPAPCVPPTVVAPTQPAEVPGYTQLDPDTGLHMTGKPQQIDMESYRLQVTGKVDRPLTLTYDDLRCMPKVEVKATLICPGFFVDEATWAGTPMRDVLALASVQEGVFGLRLIGADGYSTSVPLATALSETSLLAYEWEGEPLPILHGFPVRAVLPGEPGSSWAKWLIEIRVY